MNIKAIETKYKGYRFRSKTEAYWAKFFDLIGIEWAFEAEGYELSSGAWYLPDFWLPTFNKGMYVEVKPRTHDDDKAGWFTKAIDFAREADKPMWLARGVPDYRAYKVLWNIDGDIEDYWCIPNISKAEGKNRMYYDPDFIEATGEVKPEALEILGDKYVDSIGIIRATRFDKTDNNL